MSDKVIRNHTIKYLLLKKPTIPINVYINRHISLNENISFGLIMLPQRAKDHLINLQHWE